MVPVFSFLVSLCVRRDIRPTKLQRDDFFFRYFCFASVFLPTVRPFPRFDVLTLCIFCWLRIASFRPEGGPFPSVRTIFCIRLTASGVSKCLQLKESADIPLRSPFRTLSRGKRRFSPGKSYVFPRQIVCFVWLEALFSVGKSFVFCRQTPGLVWKSVYVVLFLPFFCIIIDNGSCFSAGCGFPMERRCQPDGAFAFILFGFQLLVYRVEWCFGSLPCECRIIKPYHFLAFLFQNHVPVRERCWIVGLFL